MGMLVNLFVVITLLIAAVAVVIALIRYSQD